MTERPAERFAARPVATIVDELADALSWPRSRPARLVAGDRAQLGARVVLCADEGAIANVEGDARTVAVLASSPEAGAGRAGRRTYDPFLGSDDDVTSWRRSERVVLDAGLLLRGGAGGVDEQLAEACGLLPLAGTALGAVRSITRDVHKFVAYVPTDLRDAVANAVFAAGAGQIGAYDLCSWATLGTGSFRGGEGTNPAVGVRGELERVEEVRFETVVPDHLITAVVRAYLAAHPYEEPAYDLVPLDLPAAVGFGRVGRLAAGGGAALWNVLGAMDPELTVHGRADQVPAGAVCAIHTGALRDVLDALLAEPELGLVVVSSASDVELELFEHRDVPVVVLDAALAFTSSAGSIAARLTRVLTLPVTVAEGLHFPEAAGGAAGAASADDQDEPSLWSSANPPTGSTAPSPSSTADPAQGTWRLQFDGGSRGNPGPAAYGWVLYDPSGDEAVADGVKVGSATNNVAEWTGLLRGLEHAAQFGVRRLQVRGDSELVVKQVTGVYRVKNAALKPLAEQVADVIRRFEHVDVAHVYRADNARADALANEALDGLR